ncbi:MAG: hypothetical protein IAE97_07595 [Chthoniobacterales bacterium]|nr:hypothetical protein [Chthoniobacterales bacterium]
MTTIKQGIKTSSVKQDVKTLQKVARQVASSKESAREFLASTGLYTANGKLKPAFR